MSVKFAADQSCRIACRTCLELSFAADVPEGWSNVAPLADPCYTHEGLCPRCTRKAAGVADQAGPSIAEAIAAVEQVQCCGECRRRAELPAQGDLPEYRRCTAPAAQSRVDWHWIVRVKATDGAQCKSFVRV